MRVDELIQFVIQCARDNNLHAFYTWWQWLKLRAEVLIEDKYECQDCKAKGIYTKATMVHHEKHVREFPELALSKLYIDENGNKHRQLTSLCDSCHEHRHPERRKNKEKQKPITEERW